MSRPATSDAPPPPALAAFLRGCERRGAVFAELQGGDAERGDVALVAALRAFRAGAAQWPMADWPRRFWALLGATPRLRTDVPDAHWPPAVSALQRVAPPDRAALLLRLVVGLDEDEAAAVLGQSVDEYRQALSRACPRDAAGQPDADAWRALADAVQQHLRDLPPERLARLSRLREDTLAGARHTAPSPASASQPAGVRRSRRWPWALAVALLTAAALVATWWYGVPRPAAQAVPAADAPTQGLGLAETPDIQVAELPPSDAPAPDPPQAAQPAASHPDFAQLADPAGDALAQQADFLAWHVAVGRQPQEGAASPAPAAAPMPADAPDAVPGWQAMDAMERDAWQRRRLEWEALPRAAREDRRARYAAWCALDGAERRHLRAALLEIAALPPEQRTALRARFDAEDAMAQRGWRLGPSLGADWPRLQPLVAYVTPEQREALLSLLRRLDVEQRDDLAALAQRIPPHERAAFRAELLAVPPAQRAQWLRQRRDQ